MKCTTVLFILLMMILCPWRTSGQENSTVIIAKIITNPRIWGKDFPSALKLVAASSQVSDERVAIRSDRLEVKPSSAQAPDLKQDLDKLQSVYRATPRETNNNIQALLTKSGESRGHWDMTGIFVSAQLRALEVGKTAEITTLRQKSEYLSPEVTVDVIKKEIGPPEKVTQQVIQNQYERLPVIETRYEYASGKAVFVTSNKKTAGQIEKAYLDPKAVAASIAGASKP